MLRLLILSLFFAVNVNAQTCNYETRYTVPYLDVIPRYHQANDVGADYAFLNKDNERDSSLCFGAAAAQAIDVFRLTLLRGNTNHFKPSSPFLMGSRFQHIYVKVNGSYGGLSDEVVKESFRLGNCEVLAAPSVYADGLLTIRDEIQSVIQRRQSGRASPLATNATVIGGAFGALNNEFFESSYSLCQPGTGSRAGQDDRFDVQSFKDGERQVLSVATWNEALNAAQNSSLGPQVAVVQYCQEALTNQPYSMSGNCGWHFSSIVGRRCPRSPAGSCSECQVLIRDSYVGGLPAGTEFYSAIPNDENDFWIAESKIRKAAMDITVIRSVQSVPSAPRAETPATVRSQPASVSGGSAPASTRAPVLTPAASAGERDDSDSNTDSEESTGAAQTEESSGDDSE